ncbi:MAG: T9SS type A sorting domain-containing protein [Saprospiraceae bacterium]|nr:T9SS type A sorting domain-containing protein [Candidatus Defluviibacterium haderslevense]
MNRIPTWSIVGSLDDRFLKPPYTELPFGGDSILSYLNVTINRMLVCQGLTPTYSKSETNITKTYFFNESQPGSTGKPYLFSLIKDMTHEYPNGLNYPISAAKIFWEFFKRSVATVTEEFETINDQINIYPNPSGGRLNIEMVNTKIERLDIYNSQGSKLKLDDQIKTSYRIDLTQYPEGIYFIQVKTSYGNFTKKWIKCQHE